MIPRKSLMNKKKKKSSKEIAKENIYFDEELEPVEVQMIPPDQLELNDAELDEEITKTLTCLDPNQPSKITHFNFKSGVFESKPNNYYIAMHTNKEGIIWNKKEREALEELEKEKEKEKEEKDVEDSKTEENENKQDEKDTQDEKSKESDEKEKEKEKEEKEREEDEKKKEILVKNQFNFSDRASQTFNEPMRNREIQTEPAPKSIFSQNANPSAIYDEYLNNLIKTKQQQLEEENKKKKNNNEMKENKNKNKNKNIHNNKIKHDNERDALLNSLSMNKALKIMERVIVLNGNSDSYNEFAYYKQSDYKKGSFLKHLWLFKNNTNNTNNKMVTCLEWNSIHLDLFAVGYGSYNFNEQTNGIICIYSLKSTVYPEKIIRCESGVMSMSFHPKYSSLICVGLYDGSVAVYDIRNKNDSPIYSSQNPETHHFDPVWDIKWYTDELKHDLIFYSISSDSEIKIWKMLQNELTNETLIKLQTPKIIIDDNITPQDNNNNNNIIDEINNNENDDDDDNMLALCSCFDFNPFMKHLYLVGTEDGHIMECNKTYNDGFTKIYKNAHYMNIYCIKWNPFHDKIFLTCSEDWTIKLWEINPISSSSSLSSSNNIINNQNNKISNNTPIITYDLGSSVNDISWSPYSSTIFAAVTNDGKIHIFDLMQNKNHPICTQQITKKFNKNTYIKLTKVKFTIGFPLIIVGDEKGNVYALKLSPNLYINKIKYKDILKNISPNMFNNIQFKQKEKQKLINVLNVTGKKVFDLVQHFSPKRVKKIKSPQKMK